MSIWNEVLDRIERKLSNSSFNTWLKNTILLSVDEGSSTLVVGTVNEFGRDWLEARYAELISETLYDLTSKRYKLHFVVTAEDKPNEQVQYNYKNERMVTMSEKLLQQILHELKDIKSDQQSMREDIGLVKSQLQENTDLTRAIHDRQEETDAKLESLTMDVHKMHGEITESKQGQSRHEKIIERLSVRSIEHEADIKHIK